MREWTAAGVLALALLLFPSNLVAAPRAEGTCAALTRSIREFTAEAAPRATAAQAESYGLLFSENIDPARPLVVLVHGLDCVNWGGLARCLDGEGYQFAYFNYPSDQPIADSGALFAGHMAALRRAFPTTPVHVIGYSMGGLVGRYYVEGDDYAGGVEKLILVATPNGGTGWSGMRGALELQEHYQLWRHDDDWSPTWMITDGLGEAGRDLRPGSKFLKALNARPRRAGVQYTVIAGDQHPARRKAADWMEDAARIVPKRARGVWGLRHYQRGLTKQANAIRNKSGSSDGPVKVRRAGLTGVEDVVIVHADHARLCVSDGKEPPAAWDTIRDRLAN